MGARVKSQTKVDRFVKDLGILALVAALAGFARTANV